MYIGPGLFRRTSGQLTADIFISLVLQFPHPPSARGCILGFFFAEFVNGVVSLCSFKKDSASSHLSVFHHLIDSFYNLDVVQPDPALSLSWMRSSVAVLEGPFGPQKNGTFT